MSTELKLYLRDQVYRLDQKAMSLDAQSSLQLMFKAASAVWKAILQRWPETQHILVLAGSGNNGGDAFALANIARQQGYAVTLMSMGDLHRQSAESLHYHQLWLAAGGEITAWSGECPPCDLIVDGLLGIGLNKTLDNHWQSLITMINTQPVPRVCIDIPSGLNADTGVAMPCAIKADLTVSFIAAKLGCWLADGPDHCGERLFDSLGISSTALNSETPVCKAMHHHNIELPPRRSANSHKNQFGHVLVVGGARGMSGAVRLAGMAALRAGAGLVSVCVHPDNYLALAAADPELMVGVWDELDHLMARATVIIVGPGLGQSETSGRLLNKLSRCRLPILVDADALHADFLDSLQSDKIVITPHPGEAARLLSSLPALVQQDRLHSVQQLASRFKASCVLKGSGTLVGQSEQALSICINGHPGMATAGSGDVLSGLIGALLGQGLEPLQAARSGVYVHALAAEHFAREQVAEGLISSDIVQRIPFVIAELLHYQGRLL